MSLELMCDGARCRGEVEHFLCDAHLEDKLRDAYNEGFEDGKKEEKES